MKRSCKASWKPPSTLHGLCTICISSRSMRSFDPGRFGVFRTRSRLRSRNWSRFPNSRQQRNWGNSWRLGFRSRFDLRAAPAGPPLPSSAGHTLRTASRLRQTRNFRFQSFEALQLCFHGRFTFYLARSYQCLFHNPVHLVKELTDFHFQAASTLLNPVGNVVLDASTVCLD